MTFGTHFFQKRLSDKRITQLTFRALRARSRRANARKSFTTLAYPHQLSLDRVQRLSRCADTYRNTSSYRNQHPISMRDYGFNRANTVLNISRTRQSLDRTTNTLCNCTLEIVPVARRGRKYKQDYFSVVFQQFTRAFVRHFISNVQCLRQSS